jgi:predicted O-methyltransferase YrrM
MEFQESFARHFRLIGRASRDNLPVQAIARYKFGEPGDYGRRAIAKMLRDCKCRRGVEIGTLRGDSAVMWLRDNSRLHLTCIDPYDEYNSRRSQRNLDSNYETAVETLKPYNATIIRKTSLDVVDDFENRSIDFLYIDGNHEFDHVMQDMICWIPKVKESGIVAIHDYCVFWWSGVMTAVNAFVSAHHVDPWYVTADYKPTAFWEKRAARAK